MTPQSSFMIVAPIIEGQRDALENCLATMNVAPGVANPDNTIIPFAYFNQLHTARLVILESKTGQDIRAFGWQPRDWQPSLALIGEVDGDCHEFLALLAVVAEPGLNRLFAHCKGFQEHRGSLLSYLLENQADSAASYVNWVGRTVQQVQEEARLQRSMAKALPAIVESSDPADVRHIRQALLTHVEQAQHNGDLSLTPEARTPLGYRLRNWLDLLGLPLVLLLLSPLLILAAPLLLWTLRRHERRDPDIDIRPDSQHIQSLSEIEDIDVSNQFNVFGDVKPGLFRYWLLKSIMRLVDYSARHIYRRGFLARIKTIHFARWVFLDQNRSMYFGSLYDGSLESYMDDFINKVAFGLNLTFSHGVGYPRTRWLIKGGAELEQAFKATLRRHQLPSQVWYHAHPGLTALDMARNARIRRGLENYPDDDEAIRQWLRDI